MAKSSRTASRVLRSRFLCSSLLSLVLAGCGGSDRSTTPAAALASAQSASSCWQAWSSGTAYTGGAQVSYNGVNYQAAYWTQGNNPASNNGPQGSGQPWIPQGSCGGGGDNNTVTLAAGTYNFGALASPGKCLDVASAGTADGTNIQEWTCNGTGAQAFAVRDAGNGNVTLVNTSSNKCVDVNNAATADGTNVQLWTCNGSGAQTFSVRDAGNGNVTLVNTNSNKCLDVSNSGTADGTNVQLWTCNGTNAQNWRPAQVTTPPLPGGGLFAPYADLGNAEGQVIVSDAQKAGLKAVTLAFLVDGGCVANWGGLGGSIKNATFWNGTKVADAVNGLVGEGVQVIISWGGAAGSIQSSCNNAASLQAMYQSVFDTYPNIIGQDFDIEGGIDVNVVAQALAGLKRANPSKLISLTLPVMPTGLVSAGLNIVNACHAAGFHPDTINVMAMDYGSANDNGGQMGLSAKQAAQATHDQTGDNIGITPDLGVNDVASEVFKLSDAQDVVSFAKSTPYVNRLAFWSMARDNGSCAGLSYSSSTCSGISQSQFQFASIFEGY